MVTVDELPDFSGNDEDASRWLKSFVIATRSDNESVMLRMFRIHLDPDSPAQEWYDSLASDDTSTWSSVERKFRQRWISRAGGQAGTREGGGAEKVRNHHLTDDKIFASTSLDLAAMNKVIVDWADSHAQLGAATKLDNATLIQATTPHLPAFLRAFLRYQSSPPTTFQSLCTRIKEITDPVLEFEHLRRQEKNIEWPGQLFETDKNAQTPPVMPRAEEDNITSLSTPTNWKKTKVYVNKAGMVEIVKEAIGTLRKYDIAGLHIAVCRIMELGILHYYNAIKTPGQFHYSRVNGADGTIVHVTHGLFQVNYYRAFNTSDDLTEAIKTWESFSDSSHVIRGDCIYRPNHTHHCYDDGREYSNSQNDTQHYGGYIRKGNGTSFPKFSISSFRTIQYFMLSSYLAECANTSNKAFRQAAIDSADWILRWCLDKDTHLLKLFTWDLWNSQEHETAFLSVDETGLFIEGLCVLASVTGEQKWSDLATKMCSAAMKYQDWHDNEGIFNYVSPSGPLKVDNINIFRGLHFRGLSVAYQRNLANKKLRHTIRSYINIQFNTLRDHAYYQGSYGVICSGPFGIAEACREGQMVAIDALAAAVIVNHC